MNKLQPVHLGEVLKNDFIEPFDLSTALAKALGVTLPVSTKSFAIVGELLLELHCVWRDISMQAHGVGTTCRSYMILRLLHKQNLMP